MIVIRQIPDGCRACQEYPPLFYAFLVGLEKALASEQSAREQTTAALEQERLAHTRTDTQREAAQTLAVERQQLRDEALAERDGLRVELDNVRRQSDELTQALRREISEQHLAHEKRVNALNEAAATARTSLAEQRSQLDAMQRENTNLTTLNSGLSVRIDNTQSSLASTEAQLLAFNAQRTAKQREWETLQSMMTSRLADKDELIASLQQQIAEPPKHPDAPVEDETSGA